MSALQPLDMVNRMCARIGEIPPLSLDDDVPGGQAAQLIYNGLVEALVGIYPFSFARKWCQLPRLSAAPLGGWQYAFKLPPEALEPPFRITDRLTDPGRGFSAFTLNGGEVYSDSPELLAEVLVLPPPHIWSATFRECATVAGAAEYALARAADRNTWERLRVVAFGTPQENMRGGLMRVAISNDAQATPALALPSGGPLINAWRS